MTFLKTAILTSVFALVTTAASAATLLSTDFNGRTVSGATASNITWATNGVATPANLTVIGRNLTTNAPSAVAPAFFNTSAAANRLAVDLNIENEGRWFVNVALNVLGNGLALTNVALDAFIFNNAGALQTVGRELDITLSITRNSDSAVIFSGERNNVFTSGGTVPAAPRAVNFNLTGISLAGSTGYTLTIGANSETRQGNNAGIDNFALIGDVIPAPTPVPLPAGLPLVVTGLAALALLRRR